QVPGPLLVTATPPAVVPFPIMPLIVLFPVLEPFKVNVIDEVVVPPVIPPPKVNTLVDEDALLVKEYDPEVTELAGASEIGALIVSLFATADRKSTRLNSSHRTISYAVFCLKK